MNLQLFKLGGRHELADSHGKPEPAKIQGNKKDYLQETRKPDGCSATSHIWSDYNSLTKLTGRQNKLLE